MIEHIRTICLFVRDQEAARAFYTEKLGFEVRRDDAMGPDARWLEVAPPGAQTPIVLYKMDDHWRHFESTMGTAQPIGFNVRDMEATCATLKARGVKFVMEPEIAPWAKQAMIEDMEGNSLMLFE